MNLNRKSKVSENYILKLKKAAQKFFESGKYDECLQVLHAISFYLYEYNQYYVDEYIESFLVKVTEALKLRNEYKAIENKVLVFDGFAFENRGVIKMYLNALVKGGFDIVYLYDKNRTNEISGILEYCKNNNIKIITYNEQASFVAAAKEIAQVFINEKPAKALFYTYPYDVSGYVAFASFKGLTERFLIDLTDHAFWIGKYCNDFFCGSREMSAYIQYFERKIPKEQLIKLGVNLLVEDVKDHSGLPFDVTTTKYIFSGGALYKTLGDPNNYYYKIVDHILAKHKDISFIYAGYGDDVEMKIILSKYPNQAFYISERKDYYYLIENCVLYLNTYPMFGGMMMKYSALAGKLPITLRHDNDSDGLLLNQKNLGIEYDNYDDLINDVDHLLSDESYLKEREAKLKGSVITEERFVNNLKNTLVNHKTDYEHNYEHLDTVKFREEYLERHNHKKLFWELISGYKHPCFIKIFPIRYLCYNLLRNIKKLFK